MTVVSSHSVSTVAGSWIDGASVVTGGGLHRVINPATGEAVAEYALASPGDVDTAVASARAALSTWATATPVDRSAVLFKLAKLAAEHADDLVAEEVSQTGKPVRLATEFDVPGSVDNIDFFAGAARHLEGKASAEYSADHTSSIRREAVGVVATITPWNYPLQMAVWKVLPALAAGCTVVIKPCELTPLTTLTLARLAAEAGLPEGVFNVVTGAGADVGTALAGHRDVDVVTFTGSTARRSQGDGGRRGSRSPHTAGVGRQGPVRGVRRRRPGRRGCGRGRRFAHQHRPGLHGGDARDRGARAVRRLRRRCRRGDGQGRGGRPARPRNRSGAADHGGAPREGGRHGRACPGAGRARRHRRQRAGSAGCSTGRR